MNESLSTEQARKLVLLSQRVPPTKQTGRATDATLPANEHPELQLSMKDLAA